MNLTYKRATLEDIDILTETRIEVLRAANKLSASSCVHFLKINLSVSSIILKYIPSVFNFDLSN